MKPQYRIFYSWQSDNPKAKDVLRSALDEVIEQLKCKGISVEIEQGGGGCGFISIEDSVRIKIRRCDIFVGDVTPVGNVAMKGKLLPNANVMYEMGIATESMQANRIIAVAMKGGWKVEDMPFDFNHYSMLQYDPDKSLSDLVGKIKERIVETDKISRRINSRFFSNRIIDKNTASGKYLPDTFLENRSAKEQARAFVAPHKVYPLIYEQIAKLNFDYYNNAKRIKGQNGIFKLDVKKWNIQGKTIDIEYLRTIIRDLNRYLSNKHEKLSKDGNDGWLASRKIERLSEKLELMNKQVMLVTSDAGQGKTNFVCDLVQNVLKVDGIPYVFVNAYELSAEQLAKSIAVEYNFIGDFSLDEVLLEAEHYCCQQLQYLIIVIDGLNEHPQQGLFKNNLARVLNAIREYSHVKVLLTCRKQFYDGNYSILRQTVNEELCEVNLDRRHRRWDDTETSEEKCLIERYAAHFNVKEPTVQTVRNELLDDLLLMRIFFQGYKGQDLSKMSQINYVNLYSQYYNQLCEQVQYIIEQDTKVANNRGMALKIFEKIIAWMVEKDIFTNLPFEDILIDLSDDEKQCFTAFINANMLLKLDMPEDGSGVNEVLNFTYEQMRDFLVSRYLVDSIFPKDLERFKQLVEHYTVGSNNLAEGTRMFLFLYVRNQDKNDVYELIKDQPWHDNTFINYIWDIPDEKITEDEILRVKEYLGEHPNDIVKILAYTHWSPVKYKKLNINLLFDILDSMEKNERDKYLETLWPSKMNRHSLYGEPIVTQRGEVLSAIQAGINRRHAKDDKEKAVLRKFEQYLKEGENIERLYIPRQNNHKQESPYVIFAFDDYKYIMRVHRGKKQRFLDLAGVKNGYAKEMFSSIYDAIFSEAKDVIEMYQEYYANEYKDFSQYLTMHYNMPSGIVKKFARVIDEKDYRLIEFDALSYGGDTISGFVMSDDYIIRMYKWLNWQNDEDKN